MPTARIRVTCPCGWAGRRTKAGGPCPKCSQPTEAAPKRAPNAERGRRVQWAVSVPPATRDVLTSREAAQILDAAAAGRR